eukprot:764091-Hanusia_phi.AAC.13
MVAATVFAASKTNSIEGDNTEGRESPSSRLLPGSCMASLRSNCADAWSRASWNEITRTGGYAAGMSYLLMFVFQNIQNAQHAQMLLRATVLATPGGGALEAEVSGQQPPSTACTRMKRFTDGQAFAGNWMPSLCGSKMARGLISCCGLTFILLLLGIVVAPLFVQSVMSSSSLELKELNVSIVNSNHMDTSVTYMLEPAPVVVVDSRLTVGIWASWIWPGYINIGNSNFSAVLPAQEDQGHDMETEGSCNLGELLLPGGESEVLLRNGMIRLSNSEHSDCLNQFVKNIFFLPTTRVLIQGRVSMSLEYIKVNKALSAKSMDRLSKGQISIVQFDMKSSDVQRMMINSKLVVNNPSIFQISNFGLIALDISYKQKKIGSFVSEEVKSLIPGRNCLSVSGILKPEDVLSSSELFSSLVNGRPVLLTANLTSVSNRFIAGGLIGTELDVTVSGEKMPLVSGSSIVFPRLALHPVVSNTVGMDAEIQLELVDIFGQDSPFSLMGINLLGASAFYKDSLAATFEVNPDKITRLSRYRYSMSFSSLATVSPLTFSQLMLEFFNSTEVELEIRCTCNVNITTAMGNLTLKGVDLSQSLLLGGCGGLRDLEIDSIDVFSSVGGSLLFSATGTFRNPSNASASLGAIALALERRGSRLGQVFSQSMSIVPGENTLRVSGHFLPSSREDKDEFGRVVTSFLRGERVDLQIVGLSAQSYSAEWLQRVVEGLAFNIPFEAPAPNISIESFNVSSAHASFSDEGDILLNCLLWVQVATPFQAVLDITSLSLDLVLARCSDPLPLARLIVPLTDVSYDAATSRISISLSDQTLAVLEEDLLAKIVVDAQEKGGVSVRLSGNVSATLRFDFGEIFVDSIPVLLELPFRFSGAELGKLVHVASLDLLEGNSSDSLPILLTVDLNNPTRASADVGDIALGLSPSGCLLPEPMMLVSMKALRVSSGSSRLVVSGLYRSPPDLQQHTCAAEFISALVGGRTVNVSIVESFASAPLVQAVMRAVKLTMEVNGLPVRLETVARAIILDPIPVFKNKQVHVRVDVTNPFSVEARVSRISLALEAEGGDIGRFDADMALHPLIIARSSTSLTPELCVDLLKVLDLAVFRSFIKAAASKQGAQVHVTGSVQLTLGSQFSSTLFFDRQAVPTFLEVRTASSCWPQQALPAWSGPPIHRALKRESHIVSID